MPGLEFGAVNMNLKFYSEFFIHLICFLLILDQQVGYSFGRTHQSGDLCTVLPQ